MYVFNKSLGTKTFEECEKECPELSGEEFQKDQYKGDFIYRNGCAFSGDTKKTECTGSDFDDAPGCAVLVYAGAGPTGAAALNIEGPVTSYEMLHGNWIKSADCKF